ncbi:MAG: LLM class F420-dependent oxidoreductase [Chloroflexota bacterium]
MKFGVLMFPTDYGMSVVDLGKETEQLGFDSLFLPEHTHIPTSRISPWPGGPVLPDEYSHTVDLFVALGAVAAVTSTLLLGTGICLVVERDPIVLAKEVASLDHISKGRVLFGIGAGWNREEMANHGTEPRTRFRLMRERIEAMKAIWASDAAEYHGEFVDFDPVWSWPKPVQKPHPPILLGNDGPTALDRVLDYCDGWLPIPGRSEKSLEARIAELNERAKAQGRGPVPVTVFGAPRDVAQISAWEKAGVERVLFRLPSDGADATRPVLKECAELMRAYR